MSIKLFFVVLLISVIGMNLIAMPLEKGTEDLNIAVIENIDNGKMLPVVIVMKEQYDSVMLYQEVRDLDKISRREHTITTLRSFSEQTQAEIRQLLQELETEGMVEDLRFLWISNVIGLRATPEALKIIDKRSDIDRLEYDPLRPVLLAHEFMEDFHEDIYYPQMDSNQREIVYNLLVMNVPDVWDQGYYGAGATVAVIDTGINYNHTDIMDQMWIHPEYPNHGYNFVNNNDVTMDPNGHGTHCAGTVAGDGTSGSETGVAPQSTVMALRVLDANGSGQQSYVWQAIQFSVTYGADIMSISLGWAHAWNPDRTTWRNTMNNALSAGVIASVAAGNEGNQQGQFPIPGNVRTPGDCPPPWTHPDQVATGGNSAVVTSGATDSTDQIATFSSRGPVTWQNINPFNDYEYNPGTGLITPDIVAPGVNVKSLRHNNNTGYTFMSGTSMAAPNVAGVMALLISKDATLLPEGISQILEESALPLSTNKNNTFGSGRVDALAAINMVTAENPPNPPIHPNPANQATNVATTTNLHWSNGGGSQMYFVNFGTDNPPTNIIENYATDQTIYQIPITLVPSTTYYWQVNAMNAYGTTEGNIWSFTTGLPVSESFDSGDFSSYNWQFSTSGNNSEQWFVTSDESHSGVYSAQSGDVENNNVTILFITLNVLEPGIISFYRKVSTEHNDGFLRFYINNTILGQWTGESDWALETYNVPAGTQTFRWLYVRYNTSPGLEDAVWIDDITFPLLEGQVPEITAPENLSYLIGMEKITLSWNHSGARNSRNFEFLGFNVYQALGGPNQDFHVINDEPLNVTSYQMPINQMGRHDFYVTAVYDIGESDPCQSINFTIYPPPSPPNIYPASGYYEEQVSVSITTEQPGVHIHYTLDGSEPDTQSERYTAPIPISETTLLKVKLFKSLHVPGDTIIREYMIATSVEDDEYPIHTDLRVYPNPMIIGTDMRSSQSLRIDFQIRERTDLLVIEIFNIKGQLVQVFKPENTGDRERSIYWNLTTSEGRQAASGIYLIRMVAGNEILNRKVMIVR